MFAGIREPLAGLVSRGRSPSIPTNVSHVACPANTTARATSAVEGSFPATSGPPPARPLLQNLATLSPGRLNQRIALPLLLPHRRAARHSQPPMVPARANNLRRPRCAATVSICVASICATCWRLATRCHPSGTVCRSSAAADCPMSVRAQFLDDSRPESPWGCQGRRPAHVRMSSISGRLSPRRANGAVKRPEVSGADRPEKLRPRAVEHAVRKTNPSHAGWSESSDLMPAGEPKFPRPTTSTT
jgi:hypothetical protein